MWSYFCQAIGTTLAALYIPGYVFFRGLDFSSILSVCCAPIFSVASYTLLPIVYYRLGIPCNPVTICGPTTIVAVLSYVLSQRRKRSDASRVLLGDAPAESLPVLYVLIGIVVTIVVFVINMADPTGFVCRLDNETHLNLIRAFLDSGKWSTLHASNLLAMPQALHPYTHDTGFSPAGFHCLVALICSISSAEVTVGINAVLATLSAVVFPLGEYAFMRALFPKEKKVVAMGAFVSSAFLNWPWHFFVMGPLYPNVLGLTLLFAALGAIVEAIDRGFVQAHPVEFALFSLIAFAALTLSHPNTFFSAYVFMGFYGGTVIYQLLRKPIDGARFGKQVKYLAPLFIYGVAVVAFWMLFYRASALQGIIDNDGAERSGLITVLKELLSLRFSFTSTQWGMCLVSLLGGITLLGRKDRWRIILPVAFFALGYISVRCDWLIIKHWTAALWYSDRRRLAMNFTLFAMPIAALGMNTLLTMAVPLDVKRISEAATFRKIQAPAATPGLQPDTPQHAATRFGVFLVAGIVVLTFLPPITIPVGDGHTLPTSLGTTTAKIAERYAHTDEHVYSAEEVAFVEKVKMTIPHNALVLNSPNDGSVWAYGVNGLNTYYRYTTVSDHTEVSSLLRKHLSEYAKNKEVQNAVKRIGAEYVLLLDQGVTHKDGIWLDQYSENQVPNWIGIDAIKDATPGFELVLSEGDMRLYKIKDAA